MASQRDLYTAHGVWIARTANGATYALDVEAIVELRPATVDERAAHPAPSGRGAPLRIRSARGERRRVVRVTALERDAARLQLKIDARQGRESSAVIKAVAAAKRAGR